MLQYMLHSDTLFVSTFYIQSVLDNNFIILMEEVLIIDLGSIFYLTNYCGTVLKKLIYDHLLKNINHLPNVCKRIICTYLTVYFVVFCNYQNKV